MLLNATPVITTATDVNHKFAVDVFASKQNLYITDMGSAKEVSASILEGQQIGLVCGLPIKGSIPDELILLKENIQADLGICISCDEKDKPFKVTLNLIPRMITIGVGCKKNIDVNAFEEYVLEMIRANGISFHSIKNIASIDLKANEACITNFATKYNIPFVTFSAEKLNEVSGDFEESEFVKSITGVGNVCERSALLGSKNGELILKKQSHNGMTIAIAKETRGISFE
jgi:cobalt-precorrin 5A hydrolase